MILIHSKGTHFISNTDIKESPKHQDDTDLCQYKRIVYGRRMTKHFVSTLSSSFLFQAIKKKQRTVYSIRIFQPTTKTGR